MGGRKDIYKDAKGFDQNPDNINRKGRPRKTVSAVNIELEEMGYSEANIADIKGCYLRLINIDIPQLQALINNDKQPALVRIVGKAIISGRGFEIIDKMLDRTIGKAIQNIDVTTQGEQINHFTYEVIKSDKPKD